MIIIGKKIEEHHISEVREIIRYFHYLLPLLKLSILQLAIVNSPRRFLKKYFFL